MTTPLTQRVPHVGEFAPDFTLAFSEICTAQMCDFRDDFDQYQTQLVEVLPISVDSIDSLKEFRRQLGMQGHFLSDFKRTVCRQYGVFLEDYFYSNRAYFLVDQEGIVRWVHVEQHPGFRRETEELLAKLKELG